MIAQILKSAPRYQADNLALYFQARAENQDFGYSAAFLVARDSGTAVMRNRIRRWLREDLRHLQTANPKGGDFIIRFFGPGKDAGHIGLGRTLEQLYLQIGQDVTK